MTGIARLYTVSVLLAAWFATGAAAADPGEEPKPAGAKRSLPDGIAGTWLFDKAVLGEINYIFTVWSSKLTISGTSFSFTKFLGAATDFRGTIAFDPMTPNAVDLKTEQFDLAAAGGSTKIPEANIRAVFALEKDRLTICFPRKLEDPRPAAIAESPAVYTLVLVRAPAEFREAPKQVAVKVLGPDGKPAAGVTVASFVDTVKGKTRYLNSTKTGPDGVATMKYDFCQPCLIARDDVNKRMALIATSPLILSRGEVTATLAPECRVTGKVVSEELAKLGKRLGSTSFYIRHNNRPAMYYSSENEAFEFILPPGTYILTASAENAEGAKKSIAVPALRSSYEVAPISLSASTIALLRGKPAPELSGVLGWKGKPVKLSELRGNYVLLEFWGYWCGPCMRLMPNLCELHEKFGDKGLKIISIHMDKEDGIDTAAKLDAKIERVRMEFWKGKELPFPTALVSGNREGERMRPGGPIAQYGVEGFPTTILIDREGKVVGEFDVSDVKKASAEIEKMLEKK